MSEEQAQAKPKVTIHEPLCKGCGLCIIHCPKEVLAASERINELGYPTTVVARESCIGCANCYLICPEPGAITVVKP